MKLRTIITQDAEVDDRNSLRHFLFYANEVELLGIVQTASKFLWRGVPGAVRQAKTSRDDFDIAGMEGGSFDAPYRWPGTDWMWETLNDYEQDYPKLRRHAEGYPTPDYLRSIIKVGNVGYEGETEAPTEGSELIRKAILDDDERTLYLQVWGGCNTIARALMDIQTEMQNRPDWLEQRERLMHKLVITACGEQDGTYRSYIAEAWPRIRFVKTLQMESYAYPWLVMPEGESKDTLKSDFMRRHILRQESALARGYCTWLDGAVYPGEAPRDQFGSNPRIAEEWFGAKLGIPTPKPCDFLSEGDSPTFFCLLDWGFRTLEDFGCGGIAGRYTKAPNEYNSKGEELDVWGVAKDRYVDRDGNARLVESMWPYVADIQRSFASRVDWVCENSADEHMPELVVEEGTDGTAAPGEALTLHARVASHGGHEVAVSFRTNPEISAPWGQAMKIDAKGSAATLTIPKEAEHGDVVHIIVQAEMNGRYRLTRYAQVMITIR